MDRIVNKYSYQASLDKHASDEAEQYALGSEIQGGIPSITLPPISRVWISFDSIDKAGNF